MPVVQLQYQDQVISRHRVEPGGVLTIGCHPESDVVIDNGAVSRTHAKIDGLEDGYFITDLKSTNGTFLNGRMILTSPLHHGDSVLIGCHRLIFGYAKGEPRPERLNTTLDKTMDSGRQRALAHESEANACLSILEGGSGEILLKVTEVQVGKDSTCDLVVQGFGVGRVSFTISMLPKGFQANYIGGFRRPKVNGVPLRHSVRLREFDTIDIGSTSIQFVYRDS